MPRGSEGPVVLGLRPEAIRPHAGTTGFVGIVEFVEPLGYESVVTLGVAGTPITLRVEANATPKVGQELTCSVEPTSMHWFDPESGLRL